MNNAEIIESLRDAIKLNYFVIQELEDTTVKINDDRGNTTTTLPSGESKTTACEHSWIENTFNCLYCGKSRITTSNTPKPKKIEKLPPWKRGTWDMEGIIDKINENTDAINEIRGSK